MFYLLPKISKSLRKVPGRLLISNQEMLTEKNSEFFDHHLHYDSYIKDTEDFLKKLKAVEEIPKGAILVTVDVIGLCPSFIQGFINATTKSTANCGFGHVC